MDVNEQIEKFKDFLETNSKNKLYEVVQQGKGSLVIDFKELAQENPELSEQLLQDPEEVIKSAELALEQIDLPEENTIKIRIRFRNLSPSQRIRIADIRSEHLGRFVWLEGIVRQTSDVRPQVTKARFECAGCGNTLSILQIDSKFKEPTRCTCGWRGKFRLLNKELIDVQHIKIEEAPENLEGAEQPKRLSIILSEDLVDPKMERKVTAGNKIRVYGIIKEIPIPLKTGAQSTRYDIITEGNNVETVQEEYSDIKLNQEDEAKIKELSKDPHVFDKLVRAIAPSIYGHEKIKEALVLQMLGGVRKLRDDGTATRGDVHILLVGDPGCIAGNSQIALFSKGMKPIQQLGTTHLQPIRETVTKIRKGPSDKPYDFATIFQKYRQQPVLRVVTETGKEVICTYNQPFLTKKGWQRADCLSAHTKIRVMPSIPNKIKKLCPTNFSKLFSKNLKEVSLPHYVDSSLAALYGYILGDGNIKNNGYALTCYINDEETDLLEPLISFWRNLFHVEPKYYLKTESPEIHLIKNSDSTLRQIFATQKVHHLEINSRQIANSLSFLSNKRVPQQIFQSPKKVVAQFLAWLFEADGCDFGKGRGRTAIQLKSTRPDLLKDVQLLLLYFGIHSRVQGENLYIRRANDMALFIQHIGFVSQKKINKLDDILHVINLRTRRRKKFQRWEKIKLIEPAGVMDVYDFEVPLSHSFIANGILCHNSGKSQLLQFISKAAPKARFVGGKGASGAGLTAAVVKDEYLRGWALEAGALVLANQGIVCLHPSTKIILNNKIIPIKKIYNSTLEKKYTSKGETIFAHDLDAEVPTLLRQTLEVSTTTATKISRKWYKGSLLNIKFNSGFALLLTPDHKLLNESSLQWQDASHFVKGDSVVAPLKLNLKISPAYWKVCLDKITKVSQVDYEGYVYDLFVPDTHNFVANGIFTHNCVDELDKMSDEDRSALHEALEQQTVTISKANIQASLSAQTTLLAAANPKFGRFDPYSPIAAQIDLPPSLLNRFDLIFPIRDIPSKEKDEKIALHVLEAAQQLHLSYETEITPEFLRKYIAYVKQHIFPIMTKAAVLVIKDFYVTLRNSGKADDSGVKPIPISARQLEALIRLSQASAKIRLDDKVTREDALRAISLLKSCLMEVGFDPETGQIDIDRVSTGITAAVRSKIHIIKEIILTLEAKGIKTIPLEQIIAEAALKAIEESKVYETIEQLKKSGDLFEPKKGFIQKI